MKYHSIAIDGPSGAGKSTIARFLANQLGYIYVDTGAMYRAIGLFVRRRGADPNDESQAAACLPHIALDIAYVAGEQRIFLGGEDVSQDIRNEQASRDASDVSKHPAVRNFLLDYQRQFAEQNNVIMDGRDIGTVVLPQADVKIFLTATSEVRANRRFCELRTKGEPVVEEEVHRAILARDHNDSTRQAAPLKPAEDSILVDSTHSSLEQVQREIREKIREKIGV